MDSIYLHGSEDVQRAASSMSSAAAEMQRAAANMQDAFCQHQRFMDDWLDRFAQIAAALRSTDTPQ
jgi:isopentenyl diphosphate isomerase/L-lactate dehydrogenase-like FMN-dependent dehydrogenase